MTLFGNTEFTIPVKLLSFIELDKAVVLVWLDWLIFCDYCVSVSALWCPLATPTVLLGFLIPWTWGISSRLLQQSTATAPYLGWEVSPHHRPSWPWTWNSSSPLTVWITISCGTLWKKWEYQTTWPVSWEICMQVRKQQLELDMTWNNRLVPNRKRSTSRLYIVTLLI